MIKFLLAFILSFSTYALAPGDKAPNFELKGSDGKTWKLSELKGKTVVLEWYNDGCPYVRKHYDPNNMQNLQKKFGSNVVWLTVNSSAPGKQGHLANTEEAKQKYVEEKMASNAILLDGMVGSKVGREYGAKTTPHMYIIDKNGLIAYNGAIDSIKSADSGDIKKADPLFANAVASVLDGKKVSKAKNAPYGCSVKY
jgi:peroxiredoxin